MPPTHRPSPLTRSSPPAPTGSEARARTPAKRPPPFDLSPPAEAPPFRLPALAGAPPPRRVSAAGLARQAAARRKPRLLGHKRGRYHHGNLFEAALSLARRLLREVGPEAVTLSRLARELGVTAPALHYHFGRRGLMLSCLADRVAEELRPKLQAAAVAESTAAGLRGATEAWVQFARSEPSAYRLLHREGWFYSSSWSGSVGPDLAHCATQALAGAGPARAALQATLPPPPPKRLDKNLCVDRAWHREMALHPRAMAAPVSPPQAQHGLLFTLALMGLAQAAAVGALPDEQLERAANDLPALVMAATHAATAGGAA